MQEITKFYDEEFKVVKWNDKNFSIINHDEYFSNTDKVSIVAHRQYYNNRHHRYDESVSYRIMNHWENLGLISCGRMKDLGWRMLSIVELVWLELVIELRKFGFPLKKILEVKNNLLQLDPGKTGEYKYLEYSLYNIDITYEPLLVLVTTNNSIKIVNRNKLNEYSDIPSENYISIFLNPILKKVTPNFEDIRTLRLRTIEFTEEEQQILNIIRNNDFDKLTIINEKGINDRIEISKSIHKKDIFGLKGKYKTQTFTILEKNGEVRNVDHKITMKFLKGTQPKVQY